MAHQLKLVLVAIAIVPLFGCEELELTQAGDIKEGTTERTRCSLDGASLARDKAILKKNDIPFSESRNEEYGMDCYTLRGEWVARSEQAFESEKGVKPPPCRSIAIKASGAPVSVFEEELDSAGVSTTRMEYEGETYIVWRAREQKKVVDLGYAFESSLDPQHCGE
jgi:hypothetical protein